MELVQQQTTFTCPDGFSMPARLFRPPGDGALPGIVFICEIFGINDEMMRVAGEFAAAGYAVLIPDLFSRGSWFGCVRRLLVDLRVERGRGIDDLLAARAWLSEQPFVHGDRLATLGLCMGGGFAMVLAKSGLFRVAAPFYGMVPDSVAGSCPMVASFGGRDRFTASAAPRLDAELESQKVAHDVKVYPAAGHSFMNRAPNAVLGAIGRVSPMHAGLDPTAAADATARVIRFLAEHL